jgi:hypothetical protein
LNEVISAAEAILEKREKWNECRIHVVEVFGRSKHYCIYPSFCLFSYGWSEAIMFVSRCTLIIWHWHDHKGFSCNFLCQNVAFLDS